MASFIGIKGTITFNNQSYDFHNTPTPTDTPFPPSEGPRSIVSGNDEAQRAKYINVYNNTDEYVSALQAEKHSAGTVSSKSVELAQLTHTFTQTRAETDHVLTFIMNNGSLPIKRKQATLQQDELEEISEEIKRQRALDTTEYFSQSSDEDGDIKPPLLTKITQDANMINGD